MEFVPSFIFIWRCFNIKNIKLLIEEPLNKIGLTVYEIKYQKAKPNTLFITLESLNNAVVDLNKVVEATHIISPIIDENDVIKEQYVLDVSSKERGN